MIKSFRHTGLKEMYNGQPRRIEGSLRKRVANRLAALDSATTIDELNLPGYGLHELQGKQVGVWAIKVSGNWRITFYFENGDAYDVDLVDYH